MGPSTQAILSCFLSMGLPLLIAIWEVVRLGRDDGSGWRQDEAPAPHPPPPPMGDAAPPRRLPDCLVPKPLPANERAIGPRVRELA